MVNLKKVLQGHKKIALDTNVFIYVFEGSALAEHLRDSVFIPLESGELQAVTSVLTVAEILVKPKSLSREDICQEYITLLASYPNLEVVPFTLDLAVRSAAVRAKYSIRTPDAIQLATALEHNATLFLTNDLRLPRRVENLQLAFFKDL